MSIIEVQNLSKLYQIGAKEAYGSLREETMQVGDNNLVYFVFIIEYAHTHH